jgi:MFS superfamily sulfate permease-like transporter
VAVIVAVERLAPRVPGALLAIGLASTVTWIFRLDERGVAVVGTVRSGLPAFRLPTASVEDFLALVPTVTSLFLVIVAQSATTSRSFAQKHGDRLDENRDLFALAAANALAGLSSTFVVNGSPTKTAVVDQAGGRSQRAQLTTAGVVLALVLFGTSAVEWLPSAALSALVLLIGINLIDVESLRHIYQFRTMTFAVAVCALVAVVVFGVEHGIFIAIALSVVDHLRQEYHP